MVLNQVFQVFNEKACGLLPHEAHLGHGLAPTLEGDAGYHSLVGFRLVDLVDADDLVFHRLVELYLLAGFLRRFIFGFHELDDLVSGAPVVRVRGRLGGFRLPVLGSVVLTHVAVGGEGFGALDAGVDFRAWFLASRSFLTRCFLDSHLL